MFLPSATGFLWPGFCYSHSTLVGDVLKHSKRRQTASELLPVRWWWLGGNCIACLSTELCSWLQPCWLVGHKSFVACCICCTSGCYSLPCLESFWQQIWSLYGCSFTVIGWRVSLGCPLPLLCWLLVSCLCLSFCQYLKLRPAWWLICLGSATWLLWFSLVYILANILCYCCLSAWRVWQLHIANPQAKKCNKCIIVPYLTSGRPETKPLS